MEITEYDTVHTHLEYGSEISLEDEIEKKPSTSSYDGPESEKFSDEEEETNDRDWGFTHFDIKLSTWTTKYDQPDVSKLKGRCMDKLFKGNEVLHGAFREPMMVILGPHSSMTCLDSNK